MPVDPRTYRLKKLYGITPEEYDAILLSQKGRCFGCGRPPKPGRRLAVDHCHKDGHTRVAVRALLCWPCNKTLGLIERFKLIGARLDIVKNERPAQLILNASRS